MIDWMFIILLVVAIIFLLLTIEKESLTFGAIDIVLWFILATGILFIEVPYQMYNVSSSQIETGTHNITSLHYLSPLFGLIGVIMAIYLFAVIIFPMLKQKFGKIM